MKRHGPRITVLLPEDEAERFEAYCREQGFKKSTLIARLIREHLAAEGYAGRVEGNTRPSVPEATAE